MNDDIWARWVDYYASTRPAASFESTVAFIHKHRGPLDSHVDMGCGTGGLSIALAQSGIASLGIDLSPGMIASARKNADTLGSSASFEIADMCSFGESSSTGIITCLNGTLFQLLAPKDQELAFQNAARLLQDGGLFIVSTYIPTQEFLFPAKSLTVRQVLEDGVELSATQVNRVTQRAEFREIVLADGRMPVVRSTRQYFRWPGELDALAEQTGFAIEGSFEDLQGNPVTSKSAQRIQLLRKKA